MTTRQGSIDNLCGIYSVLNATEIVIGKFAYSRKRKNRRNQKLALFSDLVGYLAKQGKLKKALTEGIDKIDSPGGMLDIAVKSVWRYQKRRMKKQVAFDQNAATSGAYWERLVSHLGQDGACVIVLLTGRLDHWTCIREITARTLLLADSTGMKYVFRHRCRVGVEEEGMYSLWPNKTYLLSLL